MCVKCFTLLDIFMYFQWCFLHESEAIETLSSMKYFMRQCCFHYSISFLNCQLTNIKQSWRDNIQNLLKLYRTQRPDRKGMFKLWSLRRLDEKKKQNTVLLLKKFFWKLNCCCIRKESKAQLACFHR